MTSTAPSTAGRSANGSASWSASEAIQHHYDVGNDFYRLWLDPDLTYSCAMPEQRDDDLVAAQQRKLDHHLDAVGAEHCGRLLDVGCGWGSVLDRALARGTGHTVGLTLSREQAAHIEQQGDGRRQVRLEDWADHVPTERYDGIVSVGAFEHFARPEDDDARRIGRYRDFFTRCADWLTPGGVLSLQTIAYGTLDRRDASAFIQEEIFPAADLPSPLDVVTAAEGLMEIRSWRNDRLDYAWTCERWATNLRAHRDEAVALVGPEVTARYERYLRFASVGFRMGKVGLLRMVLAPVGSPWTGRR